jgi:hypothetical protein
MSAPFRRRREKIFGHRPGPRLDRNAKTRLMHRARVLARPTQKGRHYGLVTDKDIGVLSALCWFHHEGSGRCFPSYDTIAAKAGCARSHVAAALKRLEAAGLITWVNGLARTTDRGTDLFGQAVARRRVVRTSNSYTLIDPVPQPQPRISSKSKNQPGPVKQNNNTCAESPLSGSLMAALARLGHSIADTIEENAGADAPNHA